MLLSAAGSARPDGNWCNFSKINVRCVIVRSCEQAFMRHAIQVMSVFTLRNTQDERIGKFIGMEHGIVPFQVARRTIANPRLPHSEWSISVLLISAERYRPGLLAFIDASIAVCLRPLPARVPHRNACFCHWSGVASIPPRNQRDGNLYGEMVPFFRIMMLLETHPTPMALIVYDYRDGIPGGSFGIRLCHRRAEETSWQSTFSWNYVGRP